MKDEDLLKLLSDLRTLKNAGELDDEESLANQQTLWRNRLEYDVLLESLKHHDEEIRLTALALLVESKKSTQSFSKVELALITAFLRYNIGEKFEYVPLIKKALKRMKESLAVLKRNIAKEEKTRGLEVQVDSRPELYEKLRAESAVLAEESRILIADYRALYKNHREMCIQGIRPGSTNSRKKSCLQMLQLSQEFLDREFEDLPWSSEQARKLFECLLLDTYETNKETIYKIAKNIEPSLFQLDIAHRVREIIDVALDLGNCIRPIDSITASYMLKLSLLSPVIYDALAKYDNIRQSTPEVISDEVTLRMIRIVVDRLQNPLKLAEENIVATAGKHSLYGYLFCIRNLLSTCNLGKISKRTHESWTKTIAEIIDISFRLNHVVSEIVNNSSPEGHFPMDMESSTLNSVPSKSDASMVTPQMVLICSWRTVKEVSLLFGHLSAKSPITGEKTEVGLLDEKQLVDIGEHLVTLLFETKHRGAFEQAHVGFSQLCNRLWRLNQENLKKLPIVWLHHLLLAVSGLSPGNAKLCATRRSAGVPFMVQALVSSDPFIQSKPAAAVFHSVMKILLGFTDLEEGGEISIKTKALMYEGTIFSDFQDSDTSKNDESLERSSDKTSHETITEIKTHALNILRALFKHAQLGDLSKTYAADGLTAAIKSYEGKTWAERNAATLLFSSLITRIFGVQRTKDHVNLTVHNKMTGKTFFERYPSLLSFILNELQTFVDASDNLIKPSIQPILLLLSRLYPSFNCDDADSKWKIDEFIKLVSACAKSRVYKTRELAARALVPLLTEKTTPSFIYELFEKIVRGRTNDVSFNSLHGYMLQILEIIKSPQHKMTIGKVKKFGFDCAPDKTRISSFFRGTRWIVDSMENKNDKSACFPLGTAYVTVLREFVKDFVCEELTKLYNRIVLHLNYWSRILKNRPGREIYEVAVAKLFVTVTEHDLGFQGWEDFSKPVPDDGYENGDQQTIEKIWKAIFNNSNVQVVIAGWSGVMQAIEISQGGDEVAHIAMNNALRNIRSLSDPDLQDSVYDFLYGVLNKWSLTCSWWYSPETYRYGSCHIVIVLALHAESGNHPMSPSFMRLLGKAYGILLKTQTDGYFQSKEKIRIYRIILENTWMGSADTGCRLAISSVMHDLFIETPTSIDDHCLLLDWWTSLLNLLVDDNSEVRRQASLVVCKIEPSTELKCHHQVMKSFFEKFMDRTIDVPDVAFAALFVWSMMLSGDGDYEMDESGVFNKCYNYEIFEPLRIFDLCARQFKRLLERYTLKEEIPLKIRDWLAKKVKSIADMEQEFTTAQLLVAQYGLTLPFIYDVCFQLSDIIDPTCNDKFLKSLAYKMLEEPLRFFRIKRLRSDPTPTAIMFEKR